MHFNSSTTQVWHAQRLFGVNHQQQYLQVSRRSGSDIIDRVSRIWQLQDQDETFFCMSGVVKH
jgi:hypothetical protein